MGQHFLKDQPVLNKIIRSISPGKADLIIEIGAGRGALTFPLADKAGKVIAIEKDASLIRFLQKKSRPNLTILEEDILKVNFYELIRKEQNFMGHVKLVGNLPYSLSSPLLFKILREKEFLPECIFLFQKFFKSTQYNIVPDAPSFSDPHTGTHFPSNTFQTGLNPIQFFDCPC